MSASSRNNNRKNVNDRNAKKKKNTRGQRRQRQRRNRRNTNEPKNKVLENRLRDEFRGDIRGYYSSGLGYQNKVVNPTIPILVTASANAFGTPLLGVMSYALMRGWSVATQDDSYIYWAWVYQSNLLLQAAKDGVPLSGMVPGWFNYLYQSVIKTSVPFKGGEVSYFFNIEDDFDSNYLQQVGIPGYSNFINMGVKTNSLLDGSIPITAPPDMYTEANGLRATQSMWLFLQGLHPNDPMHKMHGFQRDNRLTNSVSAFSVIENDPGNGQRNTGGWFKNVHLEVNCDCPLFATFAPKTTGVNLLRRSAVKQRLFSGDGIMLGGMLVAHLKPNQLSLKTPPKIKFVDYIELMNVYCLVLQKAVAIRVNQSFFNDSLESNSNYFFETVQCPLTIQEFGLLFRATCMLILSENFALQGLYPRTGTKNSSEFVTYPCGINTYPIYYGNQMMLPRLLLENLLALRGRVNYGGRGGKKNPEFVLSALGQYRDDRLVKEDYCVDYVQEGAPVHSCIFQDDKFETPVSFIDGSYSNEESGFACINDPVYLVQLSNKFNNWLQGMGNFLRTMTTATTDDGVVALSVVHFTSHWLELDENAPLPWKDTTVKPTASPKNKVPPGRLEFLERKKKMRVENVVYDKRKLIAETANGIVFDSTWSQFQQFFVTPINKLDPVTNDGNNTGYYRMSGYLSEPGQLTLGSGSFQFETLADRHANFANLMVKSNFATKDEPSELLVEMSKKGEGGILGDITGIMVGELGGISSKLAGDVLKSVIPI
jgi:hypothetical protein